MFTGENLRSGIAWIRGVSRGDENQKEKKRKKKKKRKDARVKKDWQPVLLNEDKELSNCSVEGN